MSTLAFDTQRYIQTKRGDPAMKGRAGGLEALDDLISSAGCSGSSITSTQARALMRQADAIVAGYARDPSCETENVEPLPAQTLIGRYRGKTRGRTQRGALIEKAFALDIMGKSEAALDKYDRALDRLMQDVTKELGSETSRVTPENFAKLSPALAADFLDGMNGKGLARLHVGSRDLARISFNNVLDLDERHGAARYNLAVLELKEGNTTVALDHLERALTDRSFDFRSLARSHDTSWNGLRVKSSRFRALVGLGELPGQITFQKRMEDIAEKRAWFVPGNPVRTEARSSKLMDEVFAAVVEEISKSNDLDDLASRAKIVAKSIEPLILRCSDPNEYAFDTAAKNLRSRLEELSEVESVSDVFRTLWKVRSRDGGEPSFDALAVLADWVIEHGDSSTLRDVRLATKNLFAPLPQYLRNPRPSCARARQLDRDIAMKIEKCEGLLDTNYPVDPKGLFAAMVREHLEDQEYLDYQWYHVIAALDAELGVFKSPGEPISPILRRAAETRAKVLEDYIRALDTSEDVKQRFALLIPKHLEAMGYGRRTP